MRYKNGNNYFTDETVQVNVNNPKYNNTTKNAREFSDIELNNQNVVYRQSNRSSIARKSEISDNNGSRRKIGKSASGGGRENSEEIEEQLKALKMKFAELCKDK